MQNELSQDGSSIDNTAESMKSDTTTSNFLDFRSSTRLGEKLLLATRKFHQYSSDDNNEYTTSSDCSFECSMKAEELVKWSAMKNIYPLVTAYGGLTCIFSTRHFIIIGTSKGPVLIFSRKQLLVNSLLPHIDTSPSNDYLRSSVENIAISSDGTHLAASYNCGDIFLWNLNVSNNSWSSSHSDQELPGTKYLKAIMHIDYHKSKTINGLGFIGSRHTGLIVSDDTGDLMYHNGFRTGLWNLTYKSKKILTVSSKEALLHSQVSPYNEKEKCLHMIAILTNYSLSILTTKPHLDTIILDKLPKEFNDCAITAYSICWHHSSSKVAISINSHVMIYCLETVPNPENIRFRKRGWEPDEPIVLIKWIADDMLGLLTMSHQFLVLEVTDGFKVVTKLDLLTHDLLTPTKKHFAIYQNELILSTHYSIEVGKYSTWSDIALANVRRGSYIGALKLFASALNHDFPLCKLVKLKSDEDERLQQLILPFYNLSLASLRYLLQRDTINHQEVDELLSLIFQIAKKFEKEDSKLDYTKSFLEQAMELFSENDSKIFFDVLINSIMEGSISALPPEVFKAILKYYAKIKNTVLLEELIIMLDPDMLDIDLAVKLSQEYDLFDILVYIWNQIFHDYTSPLIDAIYRIGSQNEKCVMFMKMSESNMYQIFDYLTFILTGREYPQNNPILLEKERLNAKKDIYRILFSGTCINWPSVTSDKIRTRSNEEGEPAFPYFNLLLEFNPKRLLAMLNEVLEDSFLDDFEYTGGDEENGTQISRQYIIHVVLDIMKEKMNSEEGLLLAIFIACNIAKYPQFIRVSNRAIENLMNIICSANSPSLHGNSQRALEALLTIHMPLNPQKFVTEVKEQKFNRVLFTLYDKLQRYSDLLLLVLESKNTRVDYGMDFNVIMQMIFSKTKHHRTTKLSILEILKSEISEISKRIPPRSLVNVFDDYDPDIHELIFTLQDEKIQLEYLDQLFAKPSACLTQIDRFSTLYLDLCCKLKAKTDLCQILLKFPLKNVDIQHLLDRLAAKRYFEAIAIVHERLEDYNSVIDDTVLCINYWFSKSMTGGLLNNYLNMAMRAADASKANREANWSKLIACFITLYGNNRKNPSYRDACKKAIQTMFIRLALSDSIDEKRRFHQFWSILMGALESQDVLMRKAHELRDLLLDTYTAYNIEEHMSRLILRVVQASSNELVLSYKCAIQRGCSISNKECEICGKNIWGLGIDTLIYEIWETKRRQGPVRDLVGANSTTLIVFMCHHGFHERCLQNLGQDSGKYACFTCQKQSI